MGTKKKDRFSFRVIDGHFKASVEQDVNIDRESLIKGNLQTAEVLTIACQTLITLDTFLIS